MTDLQALYAGICAQPDEDTPRLALADFLDEEGGKPNRFRADVIRTHVGLAREEPWSEPWRELNERWDDLSGTVVGLERKGKLPWLAHLKGRVKAWGFERGLVGHLTLFSKRFVNEGDSYFEQDPIRSVKFVKLNSDIGTVKPEVLFACPHMARIVKLDLDGSGLADASLAKLAKSPGAPKLRSLTLSGYNPFGRAALPNLLAATPELTELNLNNNNDIGDKHARELAKCKQFAQVRALDLGSTAVTASGIEALVTGKYAPALTHLRLWPEYVYDDEHDIELQPRGDRADGIATAEALAASKALTGLQELDLGFRDIGDDGLKALVSAAKSFPALRRLNLTASGLTFPAVQELADSALGANLLYLNLSQNSNLVRHRAKLKKMFTNAYVEEPFEYVD